jgi:hypothetical protein
MNTDKFKRHDFIKTFTSRGLTYHQARLAYAVMIEAFESAMVNRQSILLAHLGTLKPRVVPPRVYMMGCKKKKGGERDPKKYEHWVGQRIRYAFTLNDAFSKRHAFK